MWNVVKISLKTDYALTHISTDSNSFDFVNRKKLLIQKIFLNKNSVSEYVKNKIKVVI